MHEPARQARAEVTGARSSLDGLERTSDQLSDDFLRSRFPSSTRLPAEPHNIQETQPSTSVPSSAN